MATLAHLIIKDENGKPVPSPKFYVLDVNGKEVKIDGQPVTFTGAADGTYDLAGASLIRVEAAGFHSLNVSLVEGDNVVTIQSKSWWEKYMFLILLLIALALIFAAVKFKILK